VIAALLGAEEFGFATAPLVTLGCVMMRKCHLNTCPVGVATQDEALRKKFAGTPEHVVNYLWMVAEHTRELLASLGLRSIREAVGRVDLLEQDASVRHWKSQLLDFSGVLKPAVHLYPNTEVVNTQKQDHNLEAALDNELIRLAKNTLEKGESVQIKLPIQNTDRVVGTMLSNKIVHHFGEAALPEDTIHVKFEGSAGQSFGAFSVQGLTLELEGDANDYVGKGLSGGRVIVYPPKNATFKAEENILVGNVCLYGATSGEAFLRGVAAERFAVRNSGANAVVEGVGDHGCEYMTGGRVVILGKFGRNFAAGMSGGIAYVFDPNSKLESNCNKELVGFETLTQSADIAELRALIEKHHAFTGSTVAANILENWNASLAQFVKVIPHDYKRVLLANQKAQMEALDAVAA
jgi:glutamate synthase (NADPH/NADH) large chain